MFTGIIEDIGTIKSISASQVTVETKLGGIAKGDSIAVNGVCLTATALSAGVFTADYSSQTDEITMLSSLKTSDKVNLERALQLSSRLGGHIVTGHVDGTGVIRRIEKLERFYRVTVSLKAECAKCCVDKGSIAVDGISLTIAKVAGYDIEMFIIPETFNNTVLQFKKSGAKVNIETDILAKYVEKFTKNKDGLTLDMLKGNGFI